MTTGSESFEVRAPAAFAVPMPAAGLADYLELTKPRLSCLSMLTALVGYLAAGPRPSLGQILLVMAGTSLAAGGVAALNQYLECDTDARMNRTRTRPLPSGRIAPGSAYVLGAGMCFTGVALLFAKVNGLSALLTGLTIVCYLFIYTPAKRWSRWSTEIGAVSGALPPLIGWAAGADRLSTLGWILFGVLFFWQIPHFMAVAWTYRRDYAAVNFPMLPVRDEEGSKVAAWSFINTVLLVIVSLLPAWLGFCSWVYGGTAAALGAGFLVLAGRFLRPAGRDLAARRLFFGSITYLPLLLAALVIDRAFF
jgi:protoheme IX farnesyltransferase